MPCSGWGSSSSRGANTGEGDLSRWIELVSCATWTSDRAAAAAAAEEGVSGFWRIGRSGTGAASSGEAVPVRDRSKRARGEVGDSVREGESALPPFDERMLCRRRRAEAALVRVVAGTTRAGAGSCKSGKGKSIKFGLSRGGGGGGGGGEEELNSSAASRLAVPTSPRADSLYSPVRAA